MAVTKNASGGHERVMEESPTDPAKRLLRDPREDEEGFETLYERHFPFVWRTLGYLGLRGPAQEDAAQEVFLVVHRRLRDFERRADLRTWLFSIARNVVRNSRRGERRRGDPVELSEELVSRSPGPEETLTAQRALQEIQRFLESIDEGQRDVFLLCELEQMSAMEAASILCLSPNTISSRLRLGREKFARWVERGKVGK